LAAVVAAFSEQENSLIKCEGGVNSFISLIRRSSVRGIIFPVSNKNGRVIKKPPSLAVFRISVWAIYRIASTCTIRSSTAVGLE
jgi:hypothetical protein